MTKRVRACEPLGVRINESELAILRMTSEMGDTRITRSVSRLAEAMGKSVATARNSIKALERKGLVTVRARFLRNGGQLENEYGLTPLGQRVLRVCLLDAETAGNGSPPGC